MVNFCRWVMVVTFLEFAEQLFKWLGRSLGCEVDVADLVLRLADDGADGVSPVRAMRSAMMSDSALDARKEMWLSQRFLRRDPLGFFAAFGGEI